MTDVSERDVNEWVQVVGHLRHNALYFDRADEAVARRSVVDLHPLDQCGQLASSPSVRAMFTQLMEIGYLLALQDVRDGEFDDELAIWRPDLLPARRHRAGSGDDEPGRDQARCGDGGADRVVGPVTRRHRARS